MASATNATGADAVTRYLQITSRLSALISPRTEAPKKKLDDLQQALTKVNAVSKEAAELREEIAACHLSLGQTISAYSSFNGAMDIWQSLLDSGPIFAKETNAAIISGVEKCLAAFQTAIANSTDPEIGGFREKYSKRLKIVPARIQLFQEKMG